MILASRGESCPGRPQRPTTRKSIYRGRLSLPRAVAILSSLGPIAAAGDADAQSWRVEPSVSLTETLTNNVALTPASTREGDLVTELTPTLKFSELGPRTKLDGTVGLPVLLYARTGSENNNVYPLANILGTVSAIERFFYVEGYISISQPYLTPFGAQPVGLTSATNNRYTDSLYRISPYIKGETPGNIEYELRNNSIWNLLNNAPADTSNSYTSEWLGRIQGPGATLRWFGDFDLTDVKFQDLGSERTNLARAGVRYLVTPQFRIQVNAGYEDNRFPFSSFTGGIYGGGIQWRPSERTAAIGTVEHRFFGTGYLLGIAHRTPLSVWSISATRNITTYPQQAGTFPSGSNIPALLNQLLTSKIPDPAEREQSVENLIDSTGLPSQLNGPVNSYSQEVLLAENFNATVGLMGARNEVFLNVFRLKNQPVTANGTTLPAVFDAGNNNTQVGANLVWSHRLTRLASLSLTGFVNRTTANAPLTGRTSQGGVLLQWSSPISPHTSVTAGLRYQKLNSDIVVSYTEAAVLAGLTYSFR